MAKILVFQPELGSIDHHSFPIGLLTAVSIVAKTHDVVFIDARIHTDWKIRCRQAIDSGDILCICTTAVIGTPLKSLIAFTSYIQSISKIPIVCGGPFASALPELLLNDRIADYIIVGDGEYAFDSLVSALEGACAVDVVPSLVYLDDDHHIKHNDVKLTFDLDALPELPYHLIDMNAYSQFHMETSRGCPYACTYCYNSHIHKRQWRAQSAEKMFSRVKHLHETYGIDRITFSDDDFFVDIDRVLTFAQLVITDGMQIKWGACAVRLKHIFRTDAAFFAALQKSGIEYLSFGAESGSDKQLAFVNKEQTVSEIIAANKILARTGITVLYHFMIGFPGEHIHDMKATTRLMFRLMHENSNASIVYLSKFHPLPKTMLMVYCEKEFQFQAPKTIEGWTTYTKNPSFPWLTPKHAALSDELMRLSSLLYLNKNQMKRAPLLRKFWYLFVLQIFKKGAFAHPLLHVIPGEIRI